METTVNKRIEMLISALRMNANSFSVAIKSNGPTTFKIINNKNKPGFDYLEKILLTFGNVSPRWLMLGKGEMFDAPGKPDLKQINRNAPNDLGGDTIWRDKNHNLEAELEKTRREVEALKDWIKDLKLTIEVLRQPKLTFTPKNDINHGSTKRKKRKSD